MQPIPAEVADLRRRMTDTIVRHGSVRTGYIAALQRAGYTGLEIALNLDVARNAAEIILEGPPQPGPHIGHMSRVLARALQAYPGLTETAQSATTVQQVA